MNVYFVTHDIKINLNWNYNYLNLVLYLIKKVRSDLLQAGRFVCGM